MLWKILGTIHTKLSHDLLLLGRARLPSRQGLLQNRRGFRRNRSPLVNLLSQIVRLLGQENLGPFNFAQIENQSRHFLRGDTGGVGESLQEIAEAECLVDNTVQDLFLVRLKRQIGNLRMPVLEILQLGTGCIARNLLSPVTDGAGVFVKLLDLASGDLETFTVIPEQYVRNHSSETFKNI
jgi:hypothetical protein